MHTHCWLPQDEAGKRTNEYLNKANELGYAKGSALSMSLFKNEYRKANHNSVSILLNEDWTYLKKYNFLPNETTFPPLNDDVTISDISYRRARITSTAAYIVQRFLADFCWSADVVRNGLAELKKSRHTYQKFDEPLFEWTKWAAQTTCFGEKEGREAFAQELHDYLVTELETVAVKEYSELYYPLGLIYQHDQTAESNEAAELCFVKAILHHQDKRAVDKVGSRIRERALALLKAGNDKAALTTYAPLANAGDDEAKIAIASMLIKKPDTHIDDKLRISCLTYAAMQNNADAAMALASWYWDNPIIRLKTDVQEAQKWYSKALELDVEEAREKLNEVNNKLESSCVIC